MHMQIHITNKSEKNETIFLKKQFTLIRLPIFVTSAQDNVANVALDIYSFQHYKQEREC